MPFSTFRFFHLFTFLKFTVGSTAQETAENILRAFTPNFLRNVLNRFANQNETNDEMKGKCDDAHDTTGLAE